MLQELKFQFSTALLTVLTVAAAIAASINFDRQLTFRLPDDGVIWVDRAPSSSPASVTKRRIVEAVRIQPNSGADNAGLRPGDRLLKINGQLVERAIDVTQILVSVGAWETVNYQVERAGVEFKTSVIVGEVPRDKTLTYQYIVGLFYLIIGLFVYYRRGSAHKARHFYVFCLVSFILSSFHYTGQLHAFDQVIYFGNAIAGLLAPTLFLHFSLTFPDPVPWFRGRSRQTLLYIPAMVLGVFFVGVTSGWISVNKPLVEVRWLLDRIWLAFLSGMYVIAAIALTVRQRRSDDAILRRQLKWLRNGAYFGITPFTLFYVIPYVAGVVPTAYMKLSVLSLAFIPLTLAYAIIRYRLMDVDILFRRGYAYTLATVCVLAGFYGIVFSLANLVQKNIKDLGQAGLVAIMLLAAFLFQPIRNWIQERLDKHFYRDRYDYRQTLIEFARELSSEINLDQALSAVVERLIQTLSVRHVAIFLSEENPEGGAPRFHLAMAEGLWDRHGRMITPDYPLDLSFLNDVVVGRAGQTPRQHPSSPGPRPDRPYLFFERTRYLVDAISRALPPTVRQTIADLDLNYYLPCAVRGRTIAFLGVSRTEDGDFLSSVDLELLLTLSGYVAIAIDNARLYQSLQRKVEENERLKEFSENIVESINVGVLAVDLDDRVGSWNSQMEQLTGIRRHRAVGRRLGELFPLELVEQFEGTHGQPGIHHIYKFMLRPQLLPPELVETPPNGNGNGYAARASQEATLNIVVAPLVAKNQEQIGRLIICDDVTDRTELEQRLMQADKLSSIGLLAAGVAHEVNTPLAVISTYAQMLTKQVAGDDSKAKILEKINKQTFRASEIVNSLLNFSRTSTTEFGHVDVNRVIQETLSLLEHQMQKAGLQVHADLESGLPDVNGNPGKLQQVFLNLFLNARDAMEPGGILEVRTWCQEGQVSVDVTDTGHGIDPEMVHRIYDPFFTTKGAKKGTGLGLSVTYGIIQEHGGSIKVFSRPGGGTRFHLEFPTIGAAVSRTASVGKPVNV